ncbi:Tlg2-vesicle protein [Clarireedia jacksonii]
MPADYSSTAKALALPISPIPSPSPERHAERPPWSRRISSGVRRGTTLSPYANRQPTPSLRDQLVRKADKLQRRVVATWQRLSLLQKCLAVVALILNIVLIVLFLVYQHQIFSSLAPFAKKWLVVRISCIAHTRSVSNPPAHFIFLGTSDTASAGFLLLPLILLCPASFVWQAITDT